MRRVPASHPRENLSDGTRELEIMTELADKVTDAEVEATLRDVRAFLDDPIALLERAADVLRRGDKDALRRSVGILKARHTLRTAGAPPRRHIPKLPPNPQRYISGPRRGGGKATQALVCCVVPAQAQELSRP
jgi:hypothetical protein